jgi:hypothetical protein
LPSASKKKAIELLSFFLKLFDELFTGKKIGNSYWYEIVDGSVDHLCSISVGYQASRVADHRGMSGAAMPSINQYYYGTMTLAW